MKKILMAMAMVSLVSGSFAPKKAQAVEPTTVLSVVGIVSAVGLGIWTIYELVVVGDELSASTSEFSGQVYNKKEYLAKVQDDAFDFIAGEPASVILAKSLNEARLRLGDDAYQLTDVDLAKVAIKYTEAELNK